MKELTKEEITKLAEEYAELDRWKQVKAWAEKYYGPAAVKVEIEIEYQFNDGDPEYPSIDYVDVLDADGKHIEPDTALPAFTEDKDFTGNYGQREDPEAYVMYKKGEELPTTPESAEYDLTTEPTISFPRVVVLDEGEVAVMLNLSAGILPINEVRSL